MPTAGTVKLFLLRGEMLATDQSRHRYPPRWSAIDALPAHADGAQIDRLQVAT
jgi:hypothetical protein